jgi:hypothetical protein
LIADSDIGFAESDIGIKLFAMPRAFQHFILRRGPTMTFLDQTAVKQPARGRREAWPDKARRHGVTTRTLDRWVKQGKIAAPEYINGRKYGDAIEEPRPDPD